MQARALAATIIVELLTQRRTLSILLSKHLDRLPGQKDRAFVQELCYGVLRWYFRLERILASLMQREIKPKHLDIKALLMLGLYQFEFLDTPPYAIISATVAACDDLRKPWAKRLVNAILRRYQREKNLFTDKFTNDSTATHSHPDWLVTALQKDYPAHWQQIILANNRQPPMCLRINQRLTSRRGYLDRLSLAGIQAEPAAYSPVGIKLVQAVDVNCLPGFHDGYVSIQDPAAQLAAPLLDAKPGYRILDACAAPGGKLAHLLESVDNLRELIAIEPESERVYLLNETLRRLRLQATVVTADARATETWWDGVQFDRILLDAPCSATGVIRRHPDIKVLRRAEDIPGVTKLQAGLLAALWPLLKPGGMLLYITCSVLIAENDRQICDFIATRPDVRPRRLKSDWGTATDFGRQILPGAEDMDGLYYACLDKI